MTIERRQGWRATRKLVAAAVALLLGALAEPAGADQPVVAHVGALVGQATARTSDGNVRTLACGDPVRAGERVRTEAGSELALIAGELVVTLDEASELLVGAAEPSPSWRLERGHLRVTDARKSGTAARLLVLDTEARVLGSDAEGFVLAEKLGAVAMLCEWGRPLPVIRGSEHSIAAPGQCVLAKPAEPLYTAPAHEQRLELAESGVCLAGPVLREAALRFAPGEVAAPGPRSFAPPLPLAPTLPPRSPCDDPGSGCAASPRPPVLGVVTSPPEPGLPPGALPGGAPGVVSSPPQPGLPPGATAPGGPPGLP